MAVSAIPLFKLLVQNVWPAKKVNVLKKSAVPKKETEARASAHERSLFSARLILGTLRDFNPNTPLSHIPIRSGFLPR